jgi:hypothetical protein
MDVVMSKRSSQIVFETGLTYGEEKSVLFLMVSGLIFSIQNHRAIALTDFRISPLEIPQRFNT